MLREDLNRTQQELGKALLTIENQQKKQGQISSVDAENETLKKLLQTMTEKQAKSEEKLKWLFSVDRYDCNYREELKKSSQIS